MDAYVSIMENTVCRETRGKILCKDERTYNALIGLLQQDGVKYRTQRIYTISEVEDGDD